MRLLGEPHELDRLAEQSQRPEHLLGLRHGAAKVHLAGRQEQRRLDVLHIADWRAPPQLVEVGPRRRTELEGAPQHYVVLRVLAHEVGDRTHRDRGGKALRLADDPVGHVAAVRAAPNAHAAHIDVAGPFDQLVERAHQVEVVLASPVPHHLAPEALAVAIRAARVHVEDHVPHAGEHLELVKEGKSVLPMRPAVDLHYQRVQPARVEVLGLEHPTLELPAIWSREVVLLGLRDVAIVQPGVELGDLCLGTLRQDVEIARVGGVAGQERENTGGDVEVIDSPPAADLLTHVAIEVDRMHPGHGRSAGDKVNALAVVRPARSVVVTRPHIVDHAVVHGEIQIGRQAPRTPSGQRHHPQPFQQPRVQSVRCDETDQVAPGGPDRRVQDVAAAKQPAVALQVDHIEVELAPQVRVRVRIAGNHQPRAVRRPVEIGGLPGTGRQLFGLASSRGHDEQVMVAPVDVTLAVVLVVKPFGDAGHRRPAQHIAGVGGPRIVHDGIRVRQHRPGKRDPASIGGPRRMPCSLGHPAQLLRGAAGRQIEDKDLVRGANPADEGEPLAIG